MHILIANWMIFGVLELQPTHYVAFFWIIIRVTERTIKHVYNIYINMGLRFELIWIDYFRLMSFYVLYPLETGISYAVIYSLYDDIKG